MDDGQGHLRFSGFRSALAEIDEENGADFVAWYDTKDEQANTIFGEHLDKRLKDCSAVFCYNDAVSRMHFKQEDHLWKENSFSAVNPLPT